MCRVVILVDDARIVQLVLTPLVSISWMWMRDWGIDLDAKFQWNWIPFLDSSNDYADWILMQIWVYAIVKTFYKGVTYCWTELLWENLSCSLSTAWNWWQVCLKMCEEDITEVKKEKLEINKKEVLTSGTNFWHK